MNNLLCEYHINNKNPKILELFTNTDYDLDFINTYFNKNFKKVINFNSLIKEFNDKEYFFEITPSNYNRSLVNFNYLLSTHCSKLNLTLRFYKRSHTEKFYDELYSNLIPKIKKLLNTITDNNDILCSLLSTAYTIPFLESSYSKKFVFYNITQLKRFCYLINLIKLNSNIKDDQDFANFIKSIKGSIRINISGVSLIHIIKDTSDDHFNQYSRGLYTFNLNNDYHIRLLQIIFNTKTKLEKFKIRVEKLLLTND